MLQKNGSEARRWYVTQIFHITNDSVIADNEISYNNCKFIAKKIKAEEENVMRVDANKFIVSTIGEEVYFHCAKDKINSRKLEKGVYKINIGTHCWMIG